MKYRRWGNKLQEKELRWDLRIKCQKEKQQEKNDFVAEKTA